MPEYLVSVSRGAWVLGQAKAESEAEAKDKSISPRIHAESSYLLRNLKPENI